MRKKANVESYLNNEMLATAVSNIRNNVDSTIKRTFTFKGRKSPEIIKAVINALTDEGDLVLDPFIGSGTTILASQKIRRKLHGIELDNYTYNVIMNLFEGIDMFKVKEMFDIVSNKARTEIQSLYETECCGERNYIKKTFFDPNPSGGERRDGFFNPKIHREISDGKNLKLLFPCSVCGESSKYFEESDWEKLISIDMLDTTRFPNDEYIVNSRINITESTGANYYGKIFTTRNKVALLILQDAISSLPRSKEKDFLQHVMVSSLKLARVAMYGSSTDILYHVVLEKAQESNVWELFNTQYINFKKFKEEFYFAMTDSFSSGDSYSIFNGDYAEILNNKLSREKYSLIFTDFPYTDQVPYLERNQIFRIWLNHFSDNKELYTLTEHDLEKEIVVSNAPSRPNKNLEHYYTAIDNMFSTLHYHLNDYRPLIFFIKLGKQKYFNVFANIIESARKNGFEYCARLGVEKNDPTLRKQSAYNNTLINEVLVGFVKLPENERYLFIQNPTNNKFINYEHKIVDLIYKQIYNSNFNLTLPQAILTIKNDLVDTYQIFPDTNLITRIKKVITDNFRITEEQYVWLSNEILYIEQEENDTDNLFNKVYNLIPKYIDNLLRKNNNRFVLEDLYVELVDSLTDGTTSVFQDLLDNDKNIDLITSLLDQLCDRNDKYYIKKQISETISTQALDVIKMDPYEFESLCQKLLLAEGYTDVILKGGSGDLGVDILAKKFVGNKEETWLIQCKRWINNVDATPLQRLNSERLRLHADKVACITTSNYTRDATMISDSQEVHITNGIALLQRLERHFPSMYYNSLYQKMEID